MGKTGYENHVLPLRCLSSTSTMHFVSIENLRRTGHAKVKRVTSSNKKVTYSGASQISTGVSKHLYWTTVTCVANCNSVRLEAVRCLSSTSTVRFVSIADLFEVVEWCRSCVLSDS